MYPRYHMYELARQVRQAQKRAEQEALDRSDNGAPRSASDAEMQAIWWMGILLLAVAAILTCIFWLGN